MVSKTITAIMLLSTYCNLDCQYCYSLKATAKNRGMSLMRKDVIASAIDQLVSIQSLDSVDFNWHGGEPLLANPDLFDFIIQEENEARAKYKKQINNRIQTNATLINPDWASFLQKNDFGVGVSIDGPALIQNAQRPFPGKQGSFESVLAGIDLLDSVGIQSGKLLVITPLSYKYVDEIFEFCAEKMPEFDIIPCFHVDKRTGEIIEPTIHPSEYGSFMLRLFDLWAQRDDPKIYIRFFMEILKVMVGGFSTLCSLNRTCQDFITIDWDGNVFPCDNFSGYNNFKLGNTLDVPLSEILGSDFTTEVLEHMIDFPQSCQECAWKNLCHGGCAHQSFMPGFNFGKKYYYCASRKVLFNHLEDWLQKRLKYCGGLH